MRTNAEIRSCFSGLKILKRVMKHSEQRLPVPNLIAFVKSPSSFATVRLTIKKEWHLISEKNCALRFSPFCLLKKPTAPLNICVRMATHTTSMPMDSEFTQHSIRPCSAMLNMRLKDTSKKNFNLNLTSITEG